MSKIELSGPVEPIGLSNVTPPLHHDTATSRTDSIKHLTAALGQGKTTTFLLVFGWITFMFLIHSKNTSIQRKARAKEFEQFMIDNKGTRTKGRIPYGVVSSWKNKIQLLLHSSDDLLSSVFGPKFRSLGATHALYDPLGVTKVLHTIDPANVHAVMSSQSAAFGLPSTRFAIMAPIGSKGVVMTEGDIWRQNRRTINAGFRGARSTEQLETNVSTLLSAIEGRSPTSPSSPPSCSWTAPFPLFDTLVYMSMDRLTQHMFGVRTDLAPSDHSTPSPSSSPQKPDAATLAPRYYKRLRWTEAIDSISDAVAVRSVLGRQAWLWDSWGFRAACTTLHALCRDVVRAAVAEAEAETQQASTDTGPHHASDEEDEGDSDGDARKAAGAASFVGNLVQGGADVTRIVNVTLDVFLAGHNMTASVLTRLLLELENRPDIYDSVREEVLAMFGTETEPNAEMTWDNLQKCKKLHDCIYESMRLHPPLPNIMRQAVADTVLPTGGGDDGKQPVAVAKGTQVMCCLYLMHRRTEEWGDDTDCFLPERWEGREPGYEYAPFGGGPRICPGQLFALVEMHYFMARLMQRFKAIKQSQDKVKVAGSGAGVLMPPNVKLCLQTA